MASSGVWRMVPLRDVCERVDYGLTASAVDTDTGTRFLRITDIVSSRFSWDSVPFVAASAAERDRYRLQAGDIVIARTGSTTGESRWLGSVPGDAVFASYLVRLRVSAAHDSRFIAYALKSPGFRAYVASVLGDKSAQPNASASTLAAALIAVPPLGAQKAIGALLGALDDKIAINDQIVATADALRVALGESAETVTLPLSQIADFVNGRAFTRGASGNGRMVVRIAEINSGPGPSTVYSDRDVATKYLARPGDVLFSWSGSLTVARWFRPEAIINQHIFKVIPRNGWPPWLAFEAVRSKLAHYRAVAAAKATTMGHIQRRHLDEQVTIPAPGSGLDSAAAELWQRALNAEQESLALAQMRDELLPALMSGRRIP
ncbi:restriction endonuclease subunit S [Actinoplanes sp. NPDC026619]|uniref:restriction endonuclease subunit S n=1 Tax=Actinoplanes sp. NPDC026619 TaxID=3155798 RepID=UPI003402985A